MKDMSIIVTGASGLVGQSLCAELLARGARVYGLTRSPEKYGDHGFIPIKWNPSVSPSEEDESPEYIEAMRQAEVVVNLAGHSIGDGRFSEKHKNEIRRSRVAVTRTLSHGLRHAQSSSLRWVQASAVGFYGHTGEQVVDETGGLGGLFLSSVCEVWEQEALLAQENHPDCSFATLRLGVVLAPEAPAWKKMTLPIKMGVGGLLGDGKQWMSWVSKPDVTSMLLALIESTETGVWNGTAPEAVRQGHLAKAVGSALSRPTILPTPAWALKLALGQMAEELVLSSCKALPSRFQQEGFTFEHPTLESAIPYLLET